jgi:hypothetical protein
VNPALPRAGTGGILNGAGVPGASVPRTSVVGDDAEAGASGASANARMMLRSSQMVGMPLQDSSGQTMGKIVDLVGDNRGNNLFAVASLSGKGGNDRMIVLPYHALNFQSGANGSNFASLHMTPDQLAKAPSFTGDHWPDFHNDIYLNRLFDYYKGIYPVMAGKRNLYLGDQNGTSAHAVPGRTEHGPGEKSQFPKVGTPHTSGSSATPMLPRPGTGAPGVPGIPAPAGGASGVPGLPGGGFPGTPGTGSGVPGGAPGRAPGAGGGARPGGK